MKKQERMENLRAEVEACSRCGLCSNAKNRVIGEGNLDARIFFVGEAPGRKEDEQGKPFVGSAGKLLDNLFIKAGFERDKVYIGNIVKCRPQGNRRPIRQEIDACAPYLSEQFDIIQPRIIAPMGNSALSSILIRFGFPETVIGEVHGKKFNAYSSWGKVIIAPLYHPAAAIYNRKLLGNLERDIICLY